MDKPIGAELASRRLPPRNPVSPQQPISPPLSRQHSCDHTYSAFISSSPSFRKLAMPGPAASPWNQPPNSFPDAASAAPARMFMSLQPEGLINGTRPPRLPALSRANSVEDPADSTIITSLYTRFQQVRLFDQQKDDLIKDLFRRIEILESNLQKRVQEASTSRLRGSLDANTYNLVLIDGESLSFAHEYYLTGFDGGQCAAKALFSAMQPLVDSKAGNNISNNPRLMVRFYKDMSSFAQATPMTDFVRGFNSAFNSFEMIDSGTALATAGKVTESLKHHYSAPQCHQIIFGGGDKPGHANLLKHILASDPSFAHRIRLIAADTTAIEQSLQSLNVQRIDLLLETDAGFALCRRRGPTANHTGSMYDQSTSYSSSTSSWAMAPAHYNEHSVVEKKDQAQGPNVPFPKAAPTAVTWASTVAKGKPSNTPMPVSSKKPTTTIYVEGDPKIPRNKRGERLDPTVPHSKDYVDCVKRKKLCNVHFLRQECPYGTRCTHIHDYKPTGEELKSLTLVARMAPCMNGSKCDDPKCIYGHICPAPESNKRGQLCVFGDHCKFPPQMHNIDRTEVTVLQTKKH